MYQYPYGNAQQLNLDWILGKIQELEAGSGGGADLEEVANALVSASFDAGVSYRRYDYCFYNGKLYRALNDNSGAFNPADWLEVVIGDDIPVLTRLLNAVDTSLTSLQTTVGNQGNAITTLQNTVGSLDSDDVDNASNVVSGATVTAALDELSGEISTEATARANADTAIEGAIAYVESDFNSASRTYAVGEYFYSTTYNKLYRVITATPQGTSFSGHVSLIVEGGMNLCAFERDSITVTIQGTDYALICKRQGKVANILLTSGTGKNFTADSSWVNIGTLPAQFRPVDIQFLMIAFNQVFTYLRLLSDGTISIGGIPAQNNVYLHFSLTYMLN